MSNNGPSEFDFIDHLIPGESFEFPSDVRTPIVERAKWLKKKYPDTYNYTTYSMRNGWYKFIRLSPEKEDQ